MKHRVAGRKLGRTSAHRLALLRNLSTELFVHERVRTTLMKAKELRPFAEKLITAGKRGDLHARRRVARHIHDAEVARKLVETISTRFAERPGGYTRILKLVPRRGDSAEMAIIELIGSEITLTPKEEEKKEKKGIGGRIRERLRRRKTGAPEGADRKAEAQDKGEAEAEPAEGRVRKGKRTAAGSKTAKSAGASEEAKRGTKKGAKKGATSRAPARKKGGQTPRKGG